MNARCPLALVLAATILLGACTPMRGADKDGLIEVSARQSYVYRTYIKDDNIRIEAKDGIVTLTGTVAEESHKTLAQDTVEGLTGVKRVENLLEVTGEKAEVGSDSWIATKVKTSLRFHRRISSQTDVSVKNGLVTLKGTASSQAQKDLTTEYAEDVEGVTGVDNQMTVGKVSSGAGKPPSESIDDASITAQVKLALASRRSTGSLGTKVETQDGVTTLTGEAANRAEKDLVTKLARDIYGVKYVTNNMTIKA